MKQAVAKHARFSAGQRVKILTHTDTCWNTEPAVRRQHIGAVGILERIWNDGTFGVELTPTHACTATNITLAAKRGRPPKYNWQSVEDTKKKS